jgi:4-hydroxy-3-polyprenylbenzoate decarboxylase
LTRETPLHLGHLRSMTQLAEMGAVIMPPVPAFYAKLETIDDMINHTVGRALDLFDIDCKLVKRWGEPGQDDSRDDAGARQAVITPIGARS